MQRGGLACFTWFIISCVCSLSAVPIPGVAPAVDHHHCTVDLPAHLIIMPTPAGAASPRRRPSVTQLSAMNKPSLLKAAKEMLIDLNDTAALPDDGDENAVIIVLKEIRDEFRAFRKSITEKVVILEQDVTMLKQENGFLKNVCSNHQRFLEMFDADKRSNHLILTGISESDSLVINEISAESDEEKVSLILESIDTDALSVESVKRLGELKPEATRPRPIKLTLKGRNSRRPILEKAKNLKQKPELKSIYINKDIHPAYRKERGRMREAEKRELARPGNAGKDVVYDKEARVLKVDGIIVDRYNPSPLF